MQDRAMRSFINKTRDAHTKYNELIRSLSRRIAYDLLPP
jgi:hypothetical protein